MRRPFTPLCCLSAVLLGGCRALQSLQPPAGEDPASELKVASAGAVPWWKEDAQTQMLQIPPAWRNSQGRTGGQAADTRREKEVTAIVTHAGKSSQEFIDMAVMLAVSLKRHVPHYPRFAIAVRGMSKTNQETLEKAGWTIILVDDWNELQHRGKTPVVQLQHTGKAPVLQLRLGDTKEAKLGPSDMSGQNSTLNADRFFWRWADAFEKLNMFRLPFGRVLYLDADTYVMNDKLGFLLNSTELSEGNIGMVPDGCHQKNAADGMYNSGVMLFRPHRGMFTKLLKAVGGVMSGALEEKPDQPIINEVYKGRVTALDRKYNCIDRTGKTAAAECAQNCKEVVVTHFTGLPKPASADAKFLDIVRRPYSPILHCFNTNHGSCRAWSDYYCDVVQNKQSLTKRLRQTLEATGSCCHTPRQESDPPECRDGCPSQVKLDPSPGVFNKTNLFSHPVWNAGRPIYIGPGRTSGANLSRGPSYMYYLKPYGNWVLGWDPNSTMAWAYSHERASCPSDIKRWKEATTRRYVDTKSTAVADSPFTGDMVLDLQSGSGEWIK